LFGCVSETAERFAGAGPRAGRESTDGGCSKIGLRVLSAAGRRDDKTGRAACADRAGFNRETPR